MPPLRLDLELHHKQGLALQSSATELLYGGAAGGGKSHFLRAAAIVWCLAISGFQFYLFRRIFDDLRKNHMEGPSGFPALLAPLVDAGFASIDYSKNTITLGKSKIHLCHCQYAKDVYKYQGSEMHALGIDEAGHFERPMYSYLRSRLRLGGLEIPDAYVGMFPRALLGANPGGIGHSWLKQMFVDPVPPMEMWTAPDDDGGMRRQYIPAQLRDNPTIDAEDYAKKLQGLHSPALVRAMLDGDWNIVAGGAFDDVWDEEVHVIEPFKIPSSWRIDRSFDWGSAKPFSVCWWAESDGSPVELADGTTRTFPRGTLFHIGEWYGWNGEANEGCRMRSAEIGRGVLQIEKDAQWGTVHPGPADTQIFDAGQDGRSIADDMATVGVRWEPANKGPGSRINGWQLLRNRLAAGRQFPMEEPGLFVFSTCRHFIRTVPVLPRDERKPEDVDTNTEDHVADAVRYRCLHKRSEVTVTRANFLR